MIESLPAGKLFCFGGGAVEKSGTILLNGRQEEIQQETQLKDLLAAKGYAKQSLAVLYNGRIYRPGEWQEIVIKQGDKVDVLHFVGGG